MKKILKFILILIFGKDCHLHSEFNEHQEREAVKRANIDRIRHPSGDYK